MIAKTAAAGGPGLLPEVLAFSSSLALDRALLREDLLGSLAHLTMLARAGHRPAEADARASTTALVALWRDAERGDARAPRRRGRAHGGRGGADTRASARVAGLLHTAPLAQRPGGARSAPPRPRAACAESLRAAGRARASCSRRAPRPTRRRRPARRTPTASARSRSRSRYWLGAYGRDVRARRRRACASSLGAGRRARRSASAPSPARRCRSTGASTARRCSASRGSPLNGLDTVGDRDFALDFAYAAGAAACCTPAGSRPTWSTSPPREFGFVTLDGDIACGSSMMPQKKNPDVFELVRGKSGARDRQPGRAAHDREGPARRLQPRPPGGPRPRCSRPGRCCRASLSVLAARSLPARALRRRRAAARRWRATTPRRPTWPRRWCKPGVPFRDRLPGGGQRWCARAQGAGHAAGSGAARSARAIDPRLDAGAASVARRCAPRCAARAAPAVDRARRRSTRQIGALRAAAAEARARGRRPCRAWSTLFTSLEEGVAVKRDFLTLRDLDARRGPAALRPGRGAQGGAAQGAAWTDSLAGRTLVLLFEKAITRTRLSFEAAIGQLGGHCDRAHRQRQPDRPRRAARRHRAGRLAATPTRW